MMGVMGVTGGVWALVGLVGLLFLIGAAVGAVMGFSGRDWLYPVMGEFIERRFPKG